MVERAPESPSAADEPPSGAPAAAAGGGGGTGAAAGLAVPGEQTPGPAAPPGTEPEPGPSGQARSLWSDAWHDLRRNPVFVVSALLILFLVLISVWPGLIATRNPLSCQLDKSLDPASPGHWFGYDTQGCDVYTRVVYGARTSVTVGVCATLGVAVAGSVLGGLAGFFGGWWDALLSRVTDVFFGIPIMLGGLVFLSMTGSRSVWTVIAFIVLLGWPQIARIARGSVISAKQNDYVQAARALGAGNARMLVRHILPNAVAPVIVTATIALGTYIALEATLSYLGVGLQPPTVSWGADISDASQGMQFRNAPHILLYPAAALSLTVLAFIMLGDAVRDALDPKLR
ncbi:oligopeptide transport system permease protein [Streptomyces sp. WMMB 714]|jgi:oligopeptide transport system permease protein|uniref:ABC transporter permease n=1 Tax=Streptomyces sp. WMMB 714 TaxID=1286822 RepID=UPI0005F7FDEE|nr:ABC transporter permease [Streptomyces sp. WMMB 714]SCK13473.1 oligopeptide transport system permease protein [Streptomyces sp. WMMB 714]